MHINDEIIVAYLGNEDISKFSERWYFTSVEIAGDIGCIPFQQPDKTLEAKEKVKILYETIEKQIVNFVPTNVAIWNVLFDDWKKVLSEIDVDMIVGYPEPHDATVATDPNGRYHVIFDLGCWIKYVGLCDVSEVVQNLLTHELCHILLQKHCHDLKDGLLSKDYITCLDAMTFDEGFAHLVSYEATEIGQIDWSSDELTEIWESASKRMKDALTEEIEEKKQNNLYEAICGNYYEKYACMCGMLYLAHAWKKGNNKLLKQIFDAGYHGFASKTIKDSHM